VNPHWAAPDGVFPTLDSLTVRFIDDTASANNAYRTDELQFALADTTVLSALISEFGEGDEYFESVRPSTRGLQMNLGREPLDNVDVRLAFSQAMDRRALVDVVAGGAHQATTSWIPGFVPAGATPDAFDSCCGFDPDSARLHLADAGYPNGEGFPSGITLLIGDTPEAKDTGAFLQDAFKTHLNIDIEIEGVDGATRADRFYSIDYDLYIGGWAQDYHDPETWVVGLFETGSFINFTNCSNEEIDQLIADNLSNSDNAARLAVCGVAPFWHENAHYLIKPHVVGMSENANSQDAMQAGDWIAEAWGFSE
jgi:oligopeptide transport system substrate-binding protein